MKKITVNKIIYSLNKTVGSLSKYRSMDDWDKMEYLNTVEGFDAWERIFKDDPKAFHAYAGKGKMVCFNLGISID